MSPISEAELRLWLLADTPANILAAHDLDDFAHYVRYLETLFDYTAERAHIPTYLRWIFVETRGQHYRRLQKHSLRGEYVSVLIQRALQHRLSCLPAQLRATTSELARFDRYSKAPAFRAERSTHEILLTAVEYSQVGSTEQDTRVVQLMRDLRMIADATALRWHAVANLYASPNGHQHFMHRMIYNTAQGRPQL